MGGRKLFIGSLPDGIADITLRATFQQYGQIEEVFVKPNCEPGKQCAFVTFATPEQAMFAKESTDRILTFPGAPKECEVMIARNQGTGGQQHESPIATGMTIQPRHIMPPTGQSVMARKIHVGSLPDDITDDVLRDEFSRFGTVTEVHVKHQCEPGRKWAFVTFDRPEDAALAKECTDRELMFPSSIKPCEVVMARNQGLFGQPSIEQAVAVAAASPATVAAACAQGPRKLLVGSLPDGVTDELLRATFGLYGTVVDTYVKADCLPGRQWAFVTFAQPAEAAAAKIATDRILVMPGGEKACEVLFARSDGQAMTPVVAAPKPSSAPHSQPVSAGSGGSSGSTCKIFVGSMPGSITEEILRAEFGRHGRVMEVMLKQGCEPGRQWGFVTFQTAQQAIRAKEATDRVLLLPGADRPCEVMIARNQGTNGQQTPGSAPAAVAPHTVAPPVAIPSPANFDVRSTTWRVYTTPEGVPYYYDTQTGITQWDRPPELPAVHGAVPSSAGRARPSPY